MKLLVAAVIMLSMIFMAITLIVKCKRRRMTSEKRVRLSVAILFSATLPVLADMLASESGLSLYSVALDLMPPVISMLMLSSSVSEERSVKWTLAMMCPLSVALTVFHVLRISGLAGNVSVSFSLWVVSALYLLALSVLIFAWIVCLRNVKSVMMKGNVWTVVCLVVDIIYSFFIFVALAMLQVGLPSPGVLLMGGLVTAVGYRMMSDSVFVFWQNHERVIVESMRLAAMSSTSEPVSSDEVYKELYGRIVAHFEEDKPFLDPNLSIHDVVRKLYSNKLYVSRAISQFTGRNFCQFVNYYRITHSMEMFRDNPELKVHELSLMNGFNSIVSYNMAFRLFMGENPSEWCRRERVRLLKK